MSDLKNFIDEHDLTAEDVIDALDIDVASFADTPDDPVDFYDGEPSAEDLADDFDAVDLLLDTKRDLEDEVDSLREEAREAKRPVFADKAEELAELTEKWGDEDDLLSKFDADDEDERWTVDDIDEKLNLVRDIKGEDTTTVGDDAGVGGGGGPNADSADIDRTKQGRFDLRERTKGGD